MSRGWFVLPIGLYLLGSLSYLLLIPLGESPDEPGHLQCIEQVSLDRRLPIVDPPPPPGDWFARERLVSGMMCYHMPLYYLASGGLQIAVGAEAYIFPAGNPSFGADPVIFLHEADGALARLGERPFSILVLQLFSILLIGSLLWVSYLLAARLTPDQPEVPLLAMTLTAGWPQVLFMSRAINNDVLATALLVLTLASLVAWRSPYRLLVAALLATLAFWTKVVAGFALVAVGVVWAVEWWRRLAERPIYWRVLAGCAAIGAIGLGLMGLTPTVREHLLASTGAFSAVSERAWTLGYWADVLRLTASSGWVRLGWMNVAAPDGHAFVWWGVLFGTAVVGVALLVREKRPKVVAMLLICGIWLLGAVAAYVRINLNRFQPQFRFLLAIVPLLTVFSAVGWSGMTKFILPNPKMLSIVIASFLLVYHAWLFFVIVMPIYS